MKVQGLHKHKKITSPFYGHKISIISKMRWHLHFSSQPLRDDPTASLISSWYFWSLVSLVMIVFGCIILSFTLSSLKRKPNWSGGVSPLQGLGGSAWLGLVSGSVNLGHLASTTVDSRSGIIQPNIQYRQKKKPNEVQQAKIQQSQRRRSLTSLHNDTTSDTVAEAGVKNSNEEEWIENHLKPLSAAYKSVTGTSTTATNLHLNNGQSILPPGFINTWIKKLTSATVLVVGYGEWKSQ